MTAVLARIPAVTDQAGTETMLRFATEGYNHPGGGGYHKGRILSFKDLTREMFVDGSSYGQTRVTDGEMRLAALGGSIDSLAEYGYPSAPELLIGELNQAPESMTRLLDCRIDEVTPGITDIVMGLTDRTRELLKPVSPAKYDGSNSGTTGLEGLPEDLEGKTKIRLAGRRNRFRPHLLNRPAQIVGVNHDRDGDLATGIYHDVVIDTGDGFATWSAGTNHADFAALDAATPTQGVYDTCSSLGLAKLGGTISSEYLDRVLVSASSSSDSDDLAGAGILRNLLLEQVTSGDILSDAYTSLLGDNSNATGIVIEDDSHYPRIMDRVAGYIGAHWGPNRLGLYDFTRIIDPADAESVATFRSFGIDSAAAPGEFNILSIRPVTNRDGGPVWRITARDRDEVYENALILNQFPASELDFDIYFADDAHVQAELDRRGLIYGVLRRAFDIEATLSPALAARIDLGKVVTLFHPRFGLAGGKKTMITKIGYRTKPQLAVKLTVWG